MDFFGRIYEISGFDITMLGIIIIFMLTAIIINSFKIKNIIKKNERLMRNFGNTNIDTALNRFMDRVESVYGKGIEIEARCNELDKKVSRCLQKIGVVRYNAFKDTGSNLSFAIALLDENDDGLVINGVYSRDSSCTYAKPIYRGNTKYALSEEEMQALDAAVNDSPTRLQ